MRAFRVFHAFRAVNQGWVAQKIDLESQPPGFKVKRSFPCLPGESGELSNPKLKIFDFCLLPLNKLYLSDAKMPSMNA